MASSASNFKAKLALDIVHFHFGEIVYHVSQELVVNGPLTLPELVAIQSSKRQASDPDAIEATEVRTALLVLLTHRLVNVHVTALNRKPQTTKKPADNNNAASAVPIRYSPPKYSLDCAAAIRRLRYPHYIQHCSQALGIAAQLIAQSLLCHSQLTRAECKTLALQLAESHGINIRQQEVEKSWERMQKLGYVEQVTGLPLPRKHLAGTRVAKLHKQTLEYEKEREHSESRNARLNRKRSLSGESEKDMDGTAGDNSLETKDTGEEQFTLSKDKLEKQLMDKMIVQYVEETLGENEAIVLSGILASPECSQFEALSTTITVTRDSIDRELAAEDITHRQLMSALDSLQRTSSPILIAVDKGGTYNLKLFRIVSEIQQSIIVDTIKGQHGSNAARIYRLLYDRGALEDTKIADTALLPAKETRTLLYKLQRSGIIQALEVPKRSYYDPNMTLFCWHVDKHLLGLSIMNLIHKSMFNVQRRRLAESYRQRALLRKEKSISDFKLFNQAAEKIKDAQTQLDATILRLDTTLRIMQCNCEGDEEES
eukprot:gb/GECG01006092.1/.p1 GENE.gb/GECG01006092.1/~~gb/GECG01006092.1/.p1  ORF type:complete len:542 (+),score=53.09 gb/GECG01006092.1/:1-1626(+)